LERLKAFAEIVQAGGITAAAAADSNRQSQLSRQLKELEKHFGAELIKRGRGPMKLTAAGRQLHQIVNHAFSALADFQRNCTGQPAELHIGAGESLIQWLLLPQLARLATEHPRLNVTLENLRTEDILRQVADGSLDFGVVGRSDTNPDLDSAPLGRLDFGLFLPAGWLKPGQRGKSASTVLGQLPLAVLHGSAGIPNVLRE
jgi:DNA-binding transcriptional LysR family regulator